MVRLHRGEILGWPVLLSLALHLTVLLCLLIIPPTQPPANASEQLTVDVIAGEGSAEATSEPPAPTETTETTETTAAPIAPAAPIQQAEIPPPTPVPAPAPDMPPPTPAPAPNVLPPPKPVAQVHPLRPPPQRAATRAPVDPVGVPAHATDGQNAASRAGGSNNGAAWTGKLKQWWDVHSFYPKEASQTNAGGNVKVHIVISPDGQVTSIELVEGSGLSELDAAALAVFRNAHLPPFPPGTPATPGNVVVTLHYRPADRGG